MMARRESRVAARTVSVEAAGVRSATFFSSLASTAGQRPSRAESQSGRAAGASGLTQPGLAAAALISSARSWSEAKKARHEGSTEPGFSAHRA